MLDLNLTAPFRCLRRALPAMTDAGLGPGGRGRVGRRQGGGARIAAYTASKHGVLGLVRVGGRRGRPHRRHGQRRVPRATSTPR